MSLSTWLRTLVAGSPRKTIRRISRKSGNTRSKIDLLLEQLEERLVPAVDIWKGTDAFPTFNQGLVGQYWQGANGGSGATGVYTETYSTMLLKSAGSASWIGSSAFAPANINGPNATTMTGVIDFPTQFSTGFTDSLGTVYFGPYPGGIFAQNPSDGNSYDNNFARWSGFINIPNNGVIDSAGSNPIAFRVGSDDGSVLYIDGGTSTASPVGGNGTNFTAPGTGTNPQINNASYQGVTFRTVTLNLTPGLHAIDVEFFNGGGGGAMYFNWDPTGGSNFTDVPNSYYSTQSTATTYPGGGTFNPLGNNWSDPNNWSLGRAPQNGDTVEFSTSAVNFNPNNFAGTGSQITTNELVSFTNGSGNVQLGFGAATGPNSDVLTFSPSPGSTSLTYNTTGVSNSDMVAFQNGTGTTSFTYNGAASAADFVTFANLNGATAFTYNGASSSQDMVTISGSGTLQLAYNGDQPNTDTVTMTAGTSTFSYNGSNGTAGAFAYSAATTPAQFQAYLASLPGLAAPGAVIVTGNTGGPFTVAFGHTVLGGVKLTAANGTGTATIVSPSQTFAFTPSTTAAQLQTYLLTLPGLAGNVAANGNNGGPFNVTFGNNIAGGNLLSVVSVVGGSASVTQAFANTPATTNTQFQSYLNSIAGLNAVQVAFGSTSGNVTMAYGGVSAPTSFSFSASTTPAAFQTYLNTIAGFTGAIVTGPNGGPFVVNFASPYTGGTLLSVVTGSATVNGGISVAGNAGGPFSVTFNTAAGIAGGALLSAPPSGALITQTFQNTPATTAAALQTYLASIPALSAPGAVSVNGPNGGPFNVNFGPSLAGGSLLSDNTSSPDNAIITPGFFYNASTTTSANVQAYLASIPGLNTSGAVSVNAYVAQVNGGPYTVSYGNGIAGDPNLTVVGGNASSTVLSGATIVAQPALALTTSTTAAQFLNYLQSIPGLQVPGSVTVTGSNGGPFTVSSALFSATNQLVVGTGSPVVISLLPGGGSPGAGIWNPINDIVGLTLNGIVIVNNGYVAPGSGAVNPDPWVLTGNTVVINNTDSSLTQGISNTTVLYPNLPGLNPGGIAPVTSVISLGVSPQSNGAGGPIKFLSPVTISDVGPAPLNATLTQDSLLISSSIDLSGNKLTVGPGTGSGVADTGLTNITGAVTNSFLATNLNGTSTFAFAGSVAPATVVPSGTASNITNASFTYNGLGSATDTITGALPGNATFSYNGVAGSPIAYQPFSGDLLSFSSPGTVTFSYNGTAASSALTFSATATAASVQANLQTIAALTGKVTVTGPTGGPFIVSFDPSLSGGSALTVVNGSGVAALSVLTNTDLVNFPATGVASLAYNGANGIPFSYTAATTTAAQFAAYLTSIGGLNTATLSFPATGGATVLSYNGTAAGSFTNSSSTTAASIQTLLQAVAGLGTNATVSGPNGGPYVVTFTNGASSSLLTLTSGPGTLNYPVFVTGAAGGPFTVYYSSGVTGGTALTVVGGSITPTVAPAATTAAQIQANLAGIAALSAPGAVTVTGSAGGPFTVAFGPGITGNNLLTVSSGGTSASITQTFATFTYSPATTAAQFQAYLASIPGLAAPGAVSVSGSPSSFTITFGPGILGGSLLSLVSGALTLNQGSSFNFGGGSTTAAQFQAYLATIPGLTGAGAVTVVGPTGGPFNLYFGSGVNGNLLKVVSGSATLGQTTTDSLVVNSFGALDLGGANTYDGPTTVNSGLLVDGAANALGATFSQSKTVTSTGNPLPGLGNTVGAALGLATGGDSATYNFATATLTGATGNVALQYAGQQAATDTINLTAASGSMTLNYNGATSNAASLTFGSLNDTVSVTALGTVTFSYNGITGGPFTFSATTTAAQLQTYFSSIPGLTANGAVTATVTTAFSAAGGTFVLSFGPGVIGGSLLTAANGSGTAAIAQATTNDSISLVTPGSVVFTYGGAAGAAITVGPTTTAASIQANLAAITGLTAAGAVTVTGNNGGPYTVAFGSGIAGGSLLTVASSATNPGAATIASNSNSVTFSYDSGSGAVAGAPLIYTSTPTQAQVLAALQSVPGLTASGAVAVSGNTGGPFTITFGVGLAGASKLTVATTSGAVGSATLAAATSLAFSSSTTAAQVQAYINSIPGLITGAAGTGAATVSGTTGTGPFTVSFSGAVGGTLLTAPSGQATVNQFVFTTGTPASTTAAQLQTYIQTIPGLGSATVVGAVGGPFNIFFPAGVVGFSLLTNLTPGAITIVSGGNGITLNGNGISTLGGGVLTNADGNSNTFAAPITLTGTSTIASSTGSMTLSGPLAVGTNVLTLGGTSNFTLSGPITGNGGSSITKVGIGTATISHDNSAFGTGSTGYVGPITAQAGILAVTANNALGGIYDKVTPDYAAPTTFTYNGAQSTNNTLTLNAPTGTMTLAYNGVQSNSDLLTFASNDTITLNGPATGAGTVTFSYNGVAATSAIAITLGTSGTTAAQLQTNLRTIPALSAVVVTSSAVGGPFTISYPPGVVGGNLLTVVNGSGSATIAQAATTSTVFLAYNGANAPGSFSYTSGSTTAAALQAYLVTIPGLTAGGAVSVTGGAGGPYTVNFGSGIAGGSLLTAVYGNLAIAPSQSLVFTNGTTAANIQSYLQSLPGLAASGAVTVTGTLSGGPFTITLNPANANVAFTGPSTFSYLGTAASAPFAFTSSSTAAQFQAYLATIPGLTAAGAVFVTGPVGGPFSVNFGSGITGGTSLSASSGATVTLPTAAALTAVSGAVTLAAAPSFQFAPNTTAAQFATFLGSIPGINASFALPNPVGNIGGPYYITFGTGIPGGAQLAATGSATTVVSTAANTVTVDNATQNGSQFGASLGVNNSVNYSTPQPVTMSGQGALTGFSIVSTISSNNPGNADFLVITSTGPATFTYNTVGNPNSINLQTGAGGTSAATVQANLQSIPGIAGAAAPLGAAGAVVVTGPNGGPFFITFGAGVAGGANLTTGLSIAGPGTLTQLANPDTITFPTFPATGSITYAYNSTAASTSFSYSPTTTAAQLQTYLATVPGLTGLNAVTVVQQTPTSPFTVLFGSGITGGNLLTAAPTNIGAGSLITGALSGGTQPGSFLGLGGTDTWAGLLINAGGDEYLGTTAGTVTLLNNNAPINVSTNNLYLQGTNSAGLFILSNNTNTPNVVGSSSNPGGIIVAGVPSVSHDSIVKNGISFARLTQSNPNFNGNIWITAGVLQASSNQSFGDGVNSAVTIVNSGGDVGLFNANGFTYSTPQALTILGSGVNGALESFTGNNTYTGVLNLTGPTTLASDANTLTLTANLVQNTNLTFSGSGNIVFAGVLGSGTAISTPGIIESQSNIAYDLASATGNLAGTDQVLYPVMATTTASVPGTYGYYAVGQHIWSNSDTWFYQGLFNLPSFVNNTITPTSGAVTLAYNGISGTSIPNINTFASTDLLNYLSAITPAAQLSFTGAGNVILAYNGVNAALPLSNTSTAAQVLAALNTIPALNGLVTVPVGNVGGPFSIETSSSNVTLAYIIAGSGPATVNPPLPIPANQLNTAQGPVPAGSSNLNTSGTISITGGSGSPLIVGFPTGILSGSALTIATGAGATRSVVDTHTGYVSFAKAIDDGAQVAIDGKNVLSATVYNSSLGSGELTLASGLHSIDLRVTNGGGGAGADFSNTNGWKGFAPTTGGNNVIGTPYFNGLVFRLDQGPNDPAGTFIGTATAVSGSFPNGGNTGSATTGGQADAFTDYTIPFDPGNGSIFSVPITLSKTGTGNLTLTASNTTNYPINVSGGQLIAANNNALGNPNNTPLKGTFANTVSNNAAIGLLGVNTVTLTGSTGNLSFSYSNGIDTINPTGSGQVSFSYAGNNGAPIQINQANSDAINFTAAGTVTFSYNGVAASSALTFVAGTTTAAQVLANLQTIPALSVLTASNVTGNAGGPFFVTFPITLAGGSTLTVANGTGAAAILQQTTNTDTVAVGTPGNVIFNYNGTNGAVLNFTGTTTAAALQANLAAINGVTNSGLTAANAVIVTGNAGGPFTVYFGSGVSGGTSLSVATATGLGAGTASVSLAVTTAAQLQANLQAISGLDGNGAVTVTGNAGGPFTVSFGAGITGGNSLSVITGPATITQTSQAKPDIVDLTSNATSGSITFSYGGQSGAVLPLNTDVITATAGTMTFSYNGVAATSPLTYSATTTAAQVQTNLATIAALSAAGAVTVTGSNGGPYTVAFGAGITGGNLATGLTVANGTGSAIVASVNTTAALVQANLAAIPGLTAVGAVTVTGNNGGPFTINFGTGVVGGTLLTATGNAAITQFFYNANTTAASLQTYLGTIPALSGNVTVTGNNGGPFTVSYGTPVLDGTLSVSGPATIVGPAGVPGSSASADLTLPATKNFSLNSAGLGSNGTIQNISGNNVIQGVIALTSLISSPSTIGSLADTLNLNGTITQNSNLTFAGAGNVNVNGTINGQGSQAGLLESQASGAIYTGGQTAANLSAYGFDAALYPWVGETSASVPGTYGFYPTAAHIWSNTDTWLYQGFINVPNLTTDVFTAPAGNSSITMAYNGQLATTPAFNFTPATTATQFLAYLQTLPTFPQGTLSGGVTITGPNFSTPVSGGPFYINFGSGTAAAQLLSVFSGGATISSVPTGLGYLSFAKSIDDDTWISLDGNVIINNTNCASSVGSGELTLTAGWHAIDMRVANGGGGAGANGNNSNGWTNFTLPSGAQNTGTGGSGGLVYRVDTGPNDPFGNTTANGNAANYTVPIDNGTGNLFTFALTSLVMSGTGTVSLNNSQNLGNDTITVNSGTLAATVNGALGTSTANPLPINVNSGGTLALSNGVIIPANQPLSIAGGGTTTGINQNPGALVVVGPAGSTATVNATTTLLGTGATIGAQVGDSITLAGQLFGTSSANLTIQGANTLPATSNGAVILPNNSNAYLGNTIVNSGTLQITSDGALGGQLSSTVTINNAILDINPTAPVTSAHGLILGNAASTVEIDGANSFTTIAAATGSGTLTKTGTGILGLGGVNTYGATVVSQGNLQALNPNALGSGKITMNGGQLTMLDNTAAQGQIALSSSSYNQDVIWGGGELINAPSTGTSTGLDGATGNVLYQTGAIFSPSTSTGLPANGLISSQFNPLVSFQLGSYTANNVNLQLTNSSNEPTASLIFQTPVSLQSLNVLAISTNGSTSYKMAIIFSDGTSDTTNFASNVVTDWFGGNGFAASDLGRINRVLGGNNAPQYLTGDTQNPRLYETDFNLVGAKASDGNLDTSKVVTQVRLTVTGQSTTGSTELGVFAISGQVVPTTTPVLTNPVVVTSNSTIDVENNAVTLGTLTNTTNSTLTVLSSGNKALTVGNTTVSGTPVFSVGTSTPTAQPETLNLGSLNDGGTPVTFNITGAGTTNLAGAATSLVNGTTFNVAGGATLSWTNSTGPGSLATVNLAGGASLGTPGGLGASATVGGLGGTIGSPSGSASTVNLGASVLTIGNVNPVTIANSVNGAVTFSYNGVAATSSISVNTATAATLTTNLQTISALSAAGAFSITGSTGGPFTLTFFGAGLTGSRLAVANTTGSATISGSMQTTAFAGTIVDGTQGTATNDGVTIGYPGSTGNAASVQLTGTLSYSGPTTVNGGTLLIDTTLANSSVTVNTGAVLGGSGPISKGITVAGGALAPGDSITAVGTLTAAGATTFGLNGSYDVFFTGNTQAPGGSTEANSVLNITTTGTLALGTSANLVVSSNNYTANPGDVYTIISDAGGYDGSTFATFNGIPIVNNTIIITNSSTHVQTKFTLAYNQGVSGHHDVTLTFAGTSGAAKYLVVNPNNNTISFSNPGNDLVTFTSAGTVTFSYSGTAATSALTYSSATTAAQVLANLQTIPALSALTASNVTGPAGGPYSVNFTGTAANLTLLTVANGSGAATVAGQTSVIFSYNNINGSTFSYTTGVTTAAQLQANLAAIGGSNGPLSGAGAIIVTGNGTAVLPFNLSFSNTDTVALTTSGNVTFSYFGIAAPVLPITTGANGTTAAALAANLQLIPALSGSGAVTVTGNNGGPFTITYGSGVVGGPLLTVANGAPGAATITSVIGGSLLSVNNLNGSAKLSDTIVAGTLGPVTVTAYDANNLIAPTYTGTINWTSTDAQAQSDGFLPPTYTFQSSDFGIHTFLNTASLTMITAGSQTITATDSNFATNGISGTNNGAAISGSNPPVQGNPITVNALAVTSHFAITPSIPVGSASLNVPKSFTVTAEDVFGNLTPGYTGTVILSSSDPLGTFSGTGITLVNSQYQATLVNGVGTFNVTFGTVGSWTINAHDSISIGSTGVSNVITIGTVAQKVVINFSGSATATTVAGSTLTVTALATDLSGNTAFAYGTTTAVVSIVGSSVGVTLPPGGLITFNNGVATFPVIFTKVVGGPYQLSIQAPNAGTDGHTTITGTSGNVTVTPSQATIFSVTAPATTVTTGTPFNVTAQALDLFNNVVTNYTGNVRLTSTDVNASTMLQMTGLTSYTFTTGGAGADNGTHTFSVTLKTGGTQFITATDTTSTNPFISGTSGAITTRGLVVTGLTPTATGFTATFNKAFLPADVFLYNSNLTTTADVVMIGTSDTITLSSSGTLKATYNNKAATPSATFGFTSATTNSAFAAYLATIPTLSAPGAVSVTGPNGGPFVVHFGPGLAGGTSLVVTTSAGTANLQNVGKISGSILINPNNQSFVFKATTNNLIQKNTLNNPAGDQAYTSPVLPDSDYLIQFISGTGFGGAAVNGFFDNVGLPLDGSNNGTTTNFTTSFSTSFQANHTPVLAIPDFARGPDSSGPNTQVVAAQSVPTVGVPSYLNGPNTGPGADGSNAGSNPVYGSPAQSVGAGIPVVLYNAAHVTDVTFTVSYNPNLLSGVTGFGGPGSDAYYAPLATQNPPNGDATNNTNLVMVGSPVISGGVATATFHYTVNTALDPTGFTATPDSPLVLGDILGVVPSGNVAVSAITETGNVVTVTEAATNSFTSSLAVGQSISINGVNATDTITFTGTAGNVKFAYNGTAAATNLAYNPATTTAANVQTYLQTIPALTPAGNVTVTGNTGGPFTVSFGASVDPTKLTVSTGSTLVSIAVVASPYNSNANGNGLFTVASVNAAAHQFTYNLTTATNAISSAGGGAGVAALGLYQQKDLLQLGAITINTNASTGAVASNGIHVNTYLADVNGDKVIDGLDKLAANFIATATGSASVGIGFSAFTHMDPTIVGDPAGDFTVDAGDVTTIDSFVAQLNPPQIPPPPTQLLTTNPNFLNKAFISSPTAADPMISLPTGIDANADGIVNVPVLLDHPHPEGSTGLNGASLSLTYDPTVLNLTASDITLGNIPGLGTGWELTAEVDPTTGQIGIQLYGSAPITATQAGSLVNIAFHIVPGATVSSTMVNLVNSATPNGERFDTTLTDTQGGLILTEGVDRLMIVTGATDVIASVSMPMSTATTTTDMAFLTSHQVSIDMLARSFAPEASGPSSLLVGSEGGDGAALVVLSNGVVAGESASVHTVPVNLIVTGALAFQTNTNPVAATQLSGQVMQVANISWLNLLNVSGQQSAAERMFLATARGTDAPTELGQLSQSLNGLLWGMAAPQLDWLVDPAQTITAPRQQDSADGTADQQSSVDSDRIAVVDQVFAEFANETDDFGDLGSEN